MFVFVCFRLTLHQPLATSTFLFSLVHPLHLARPPHPSPIVANPLLKGIRVTAPHPPSAGPPTTSRMPGVKEGPGMGCVRTQRGRGTTWEDGERGYGPVRVKGAGWATPVAHNPEQVSGWRASEARPVQPGEGGWGRFRATLMGEGVRGRKQRNWGGWGRVHRVMHNPGREGEGERSNTQPRRAKARVCSVHHADGSVHIAHAAY
ncbi:hypothetical protein V8E53_008588 [Lactarius tabidus]